MVVFAGTPKNEITQGVTIDSGIKMMKNKKICSQTKILFDLKWYFSTDLLMYLFLSPLPLKEKSFPLTKIVGLAW